MNAQVKQEPLHIECAYSPFDSLVVECGNSFVNIEVRADGEYVNLRREDVVSLVNYLLTYIESQE